MPYQLVAYINNLFTYFMYQHSFVRSRERDSDAKSS